MIFCSLHFSLLFSKERHQHFINISRERIWPVYIFMLWRFLCVWKLCFQIQSLTIATLTGCFKLSILCLWVWTWLSIFPFINPNELMTLNISIRYPNCHFISQPIHYALIFTRRKTLEDQALKVPEMLSLYHFL